MHIDELYPSKYLKAADLGSKEFLVTIAHYEVDEVINPRNKHRDRRAVLFFLSGQKGLVLSAHNARAIATVYGPELDQWAGCRIILYVERGVEAFGELFDVIRVRPASPPAASGPETEQDSPLPEESVAEEEAGVAAASSLPLDAPIDEADLAAAGPSPDTGKQAGAPATTTSTQANSTQGPPRGGQGQYRAGTGRSSYGRR